MGVILSCAINKDAGKKLSIDQSVTENNEEQNPDLSQNSQNLIPTLKLHTISSKNNSEMLSTASKLLDPEWDVYFPKLGVIIISAVFDEITQIPFTVHLKVCGKKLSADHNQKQKERLTLPIGSITICDAGTRIITTKLDGIDTQNLKYIELSGLGVIGARNMSPGAQRLVITWPELSQCTHFYSRLKVNLTNSNRIFGIFWFYFVQFGLRDSSSQRSIWMNVCQTKPMVDLDFQVIDVDAGAKLSQISSEDALIHQYSIPFSWELDVNYHVLIHCELIDKTQLFTIYFKCEEELDWKKLAVFKFCNKESNHHPLFASFVEEKIINGNFASPVWKAQFGPCWYKKGEWKQVEQVSIDYNDVLPSAIAISIENKVCLQMDKVSLNEKRNDRLNLVVKNELPSVLQSLPFCE